MKKIFLAFISLTLLFITSGCDKDLPYPIDQVTKGVLVDITRVAGTDPVMYDGDVSGNFKVKLLIPENQGDYSQLKYVQLLAVLENVDETITSHVVVDNITQFPSELTIDVADIFGKFGQAAPIAAQALSFTVNVVLNDGTVIPGWTKETGFNNEKFLNWPVEDRYYSNKVMYPVVCELVLDDFVGTCTVTLDEWWGMTPYPVEVTKISDTELSIKGLFNGEAVNPLIITVNKEEYTVSFPKQVLLPNSALLWWESDGTAYDNFSLEGLGTINSCETSISFTAEARVNAGGFGDNSFKLGKIK
ncbi:hypothetical protein D0T84_04710 [Dysgonomonas sp. 521]|uniref:hypothetical protein n=1 Tax=Dysgonomonas sp. 521 TaxID=2302932 RepID=UPI0013D0CBAB|nr:hypothetical protein [Dysgonomonas sp. 521]NDV94220.1 hypothetical protein [Dysgonomonas sp. 521]